MPFLVTEPQRIEGTKLGFAIYPYHHSFDDHIDFSTKYNQKLMFFKLKDTPYNEIDKVLGEERYLFNDVYRGFVENKIKEFVCKNPQYVVDPQKTEKYIAKITEHHKGDEGK